MSSTAVDDTDPRFTYKDNAWTVSGQSGEFDSTSHSTSTAGAVVQFGPFSGTSVTIFGTLHTSQPKIHFQVDNGAQNFDRPASSSSTVQFQQQLYSATNLDPALQHTLNINILDAGPFTLDYLLIGNSLLSAISAPPSSTFTQGVGGDVTSASQLKAPASDSASSSMSSTPSPALPSSSPLPVGAGSSPTLPILSGLPTSADTTTIGSTSSASGPTSTSATPTAAASSGGPDAIVIGSVTGSIAFLAIAVVSMVLFLRRRRLAQRGRTVPNNKPSGWQDPQPPHRPPLHLSIPSSMSIPRNLSRPSLLPTHCNKSVTSSTKHPPPFGASHPTPLFLAEDPNDSPVFDIKQRPISGSTMTTRVTVGTTIGQRASVPESVYRYPYPETAVPVPVPVPVPPIPSAPTKIDNPSPTETGVSSATGYSTRLGFGFLDTNPSGTLATSIFSGFSDNSNPTAGPGVSAPRPLPYTPADTKRAHETGEHAAQTQMNTHGHRFLPTTPSKVETVIHRDGGVRLASNVPFQPRRELPPPYQDYGV